MPETAHISPFIKTRYNEFLYEEYEAWTARQCHCFDREMEHSRIETVAVKVKIIKIMQKDDHPKKIAVMLEDQNTSLWHKFDEEFFIVDESELFVSKEDAIAILVAKVANTTDGTMPWGHEGHEVGDIVYIYNDRKKDVTEGKIIEIQANLIHANAIVQTTVPNEAFMFEDKYLRGRKLVCRVDILHKSPDRNEW